MWCADDVAGVPLTQPLSAGTSPSRSALTPRVDYHQHLVSAAFAPIAKRPPRDGRALLAELDSAGIEKAVVLSVGYSCGDERKNLPDPDRLTREENDWTSTQVVGSGGRLIGFCSANPLQNYGAEDARLFLDRLVAVAPSIDIVVAHLGGAGPGISAQPGGSITTGWEIFRARIPLTAEEMATIVGNVTRFAR